MVQDWSTKDWSRLVLGLQKTQKTGLEWSQSQSYNFVISLGPVLVLVFPKKAKKPDWTGLLNTMCSYSKWETLALAICEADANTDLVNRMYTCGNDKLLDDIL